MCKRHWFMVPKQMRDRVWATYRPGQCDDWQPSAAYCDAATEAVQAVAEKEGIEPDVELYRVFRPDEERPSGTLRLSLYQAFVEKYRDCTACPLHLTRNRIVLAKGTIPCDILFTGEAPGRSEDTSGVPFWGPAGHLLDRIIQDSIPVEVSKAFCNVVCCLPLGIDGDKSLEPELDHKKACSSRLVEFIELCHPKLIVAVGKVAEDWLDPRRYKGIKLDPEIRQVHITHPSAILKANPAAKPLMIKKCIVTLRNVVAELFAEKVPT